MWPVLAVVAAGDFIAFWIILSTALPVEEWVTWLLTAAMTASAVLLMHIGGRLQREFRTYPDAHGRFKHWLVVGLWLLLGSIAFLVRLTAELNATVSSGFGESVEPVNVWAPEVLPLSLLLLALYLVGGAGAFIIGYLAHDPRHKPSHRLQVRQRRARRALAWAQWRARRPRAKAAAALAQRERLDQLHSASRDRALELAAILRESTRLQLATARRRPVRAPALVEAQNELDSALESAAAADSELVRLQSLRTDDEAEPDSAGWSLLRADEDALRAHYTTLRQRVLLGQLAAGPQRATLATAPAAKELQDATATVDQGSARVLELVELVGSTDELRTAQEDALRSQAQELTELARVRIAQHVGDPASTSALLSSATR